MDIQRVWALCYSATGATDKVVTTMAEAAAERLGVPVERRSFTSPAERRQSYMFGGTDLVFVGCPTYAGRLPNKIAPDLWAALHGNGALAAAVVTFGNRAYENSLAELCALLEATGFHTAAAGAFVGQHAFTEELAYGCPGWGDLFEAKGFAQEVVRRVRTLSGPPAPVRVPGVPDAPYYVPTGADGAPVDFLRAKPKTHLSRCTRCGACARLCPMGAIDPKNFVDVPGTCIKCQRCVRRCTKRAKYFDDPAFLSHVAMLEANFRTPQDNAVFLSEL